MLAMAAENHRGEPADHVRTCVGCGKSAPRSEARRASARLQRAEEQASAGGAALVRIVIGPDRAIAVDAGDSRFGRGAYVHATPACVAAAVRGLARAARGNVTLDGLPVTGPSLRAAISASYDRRVAGLLAAAKRARKLECGADAAQAACRAGQGALVVLATDAAQAADLTEARRATKEGRAIPWGTKVALADAVAGAFGLSTDGRPEARGFGVVAVTDERMARAIKEAWLVAAALAVGDPTKGPILPSIPAEGAARLPRADGAGGSQSSDRGSPRNPGGSSGAVE